MRDGLIPGRHTTTKLEHDEPSSMMDMRARQAISIVEGEGGDGLGRYSYFTAIDGPTYSYLSLDPVVEVELTRDLDGASPPKLEGDWLLVLARLTAWSTITWRREEATSQ